MTSQHPELVAERQAKLDALGPRPPWWRFLSRRRWNVKRGSIMAMDVSAFAWFYRREYPADRITEMANRPHPMFSTMRAAGKQLFVEPVSYETKE